MVCSELFKAGFAGSWKLIDEGLVRGVICAALYPNLVKAERTKAKNGMYEKLSLGDGVQARLHESRCLQHFQNLMTLLAGLDASELCQRKR